MITSRNKVIQSNHIFGQLVLGPPGSGKSTYCFEMSKYLREIGREVSIINLDPGNENMKYTPDIDIMNLIKVEDVMEFHKLGPNGSLMYCMEYLEKNVKWLISELKKLKPSYLIFDCPGQIEIFTHSRCLSNIFNKLEIMGYHLCSVNLIESHYCSEPTKFISTLLLSLNIMLNISLPHVNVLSKAELFKRFESKLIFNLEFYTEVLDLKFLLEAIDFDFPKYAKLNAAIVSMVEDYSLVTFELLDYYNKTTVAKVKHAIDKANGYINASEESND
ncbi:GPN-loop GTPase 2 [Condylostylus longicornis]|uniref:GPN-loop GTPase 2 n=1 Tax=Condylostylus longicornis TaxID=2530218 RepID=UPI00244DB98D|nr:GPN-loop GTPase 2 [Condylostylus longicornis]